MSDEATESLPASTLPASQRTPCERCGDFAALVPYDGHQICEDCIGRLSEIERTPPTVGNLVSGALWVMSKIGLPAALIVVLADVPIVLMENFVDGLPPIISTLWGSTVAVIAQGSVLVLAQRAIRGEPLDLQRPIKRSLEAAGNLIVSNFVAGLQILLFTLLLVIPGIMRGLSFALVMPIVVNEHGADRGLSALDVSKQRMNGHRLVALAAYLVWGAIWMTFFAGYFAFIFAIETPGALDVSESLISIVLVGGGLLMPVLMIPVICTTAVLYAKTLQYRVY